MKFDKQNLIPNCKCVVCDEELYPAPLNNPNDYWIDLQYPKGIHHRCIDHLYEVLSTMRKAPVMEF